MPVNGTRSRPPSPPPLTTRSAPQPNQLKRTPTQSPASPTAKTATTTPASPTSAAPGSNQVVLSKVSREKPVDPKAQARLNDINASNQPMMTSTVNAPEGSTSTTLFEKTGPQTTFGKGVGEAHTGSVNVTHTSKRDKVFHEGISVDVEGPGASLDWKKTQESRLGETSAFANGQVQTAAHAHAAATADLSSLESARLEIDANARASAEAEVSAGVSHKVNDSVDASVGVDGKASAYAFAHAGGVLDLKHKTAGVHLGAGAGATASANVVADVHVGPFRDHLEVGATAGVGAQAGLEAEVRNGNATLRTHAQGAIINGFHVDNTLSYDGNYDVKEHLKHFEDKHGLRGHHTLFAALKAPLQVAAPVAMPAAVPLSGAPVAKAT